MNTTFIMLLALVIFLGAGFGGSFVGGVIYGQNLAENAEDELSPRLGAGGQFPGGGQGAAAGQRGQGGQGRGGSVAAAQGQSGGPGGGQGQDSPAAARQGGGAGNFPGGQGRQGRPDVATADEAGAAANVADGAAAARQTEDTPDGQQRNRPGRATQSDVPGGETQPQGPSGSETATVQQTPASEGEQGEGGTRSASGRAGISGAVLAVDDDALTLESPRGELAVTLSESTAIYEVSESGREALAAETRVRVLGSRNPDGVILAQSVVIVPEGVENLFVAGGPPGGRQRGQAP